MLKTINYETTTYETKFGNVLLDVVKTEECYEAWLYDKGVGNKMFMFGLPLNYKYETVMEIFENEIENYVERLEV